MYKSCPLNGLSIIPPGLVAAGVISPPFPYCDVVTLTANKTLRGYRAGLLFFRRGGREVPGRGLVPYNIEHQLNFAVVPTVQVDRRAYVIFISKR